MKKVIIICAFAIMAVSCNKSKIRTCTITASDGTKYTAISPNPMTRSEMNTYEEQLILQNSANGGEKAKVSCK